MHVYNLSPGLGVWDTCFARCLAIVFNLASQLSQAAPSGIVAWLMPVSVYITGCVPWWHILLLQQNPKQSHTPKQLEAKGLQFVLVNFPKF